MEFGLLGPVLVDAGDGPLVVNVPKQRVVLVALLLQANKVVTAEQLTELIWHGTPPATARTALQNHVMRLRSTPGSPAAGSGTSPAPAATAPTSAAPAPSCPC
ncbi:AfsR/SARP family transcriptional regulator [Kitasatospora sp. McL0602]|uniref:AfsR/SARP family transcriptional regulator n=1 Tax=Kitasatospora sp. McL0602 TaxID=3439530 RepID=UPI003F8A5D71